MNINYHLIYACFYFCSFDVRGRNSAEGKHWSATEPFGNRAFFRVGTDPTFLLINDVRLEVNLSKVCIYVFIAEFAPYPSRPTICS